jgi:hypothetical protein
MLLGAEMKEGYKRKTHGSVGVGGVTYRYGVPAEPDGKGPFGWLKCRWGIVLKKS